MVHHGFSLGTLSKVVHYWIDITGHVRPVVFQAHRVGRLAMSGLSFQSWMVVRYLRLALYKLLTTSGPALSTVESLTNTPLRATKNFEFGLSHGGGVMLGVWASRPCGCELRK